MGFGSDYVTPDLPSVFSIGGDFTYANTPHTAHTHTLLAGEAPNPILVCWEGWRTDRLLT